MNTLDKMKKIEEVLLKYAFIWSHEPIDYYPQIPKNLQSFLSHLKELNHSELIAIENLISNSSSDFINEYIKEIQTHLVPTAELREIKSFNQQETQGLTQKKIHEIQRLVPFMTSLKNKKIFDIGSGKAHLSFLLAKNDPTKRFICIDQDRTLQESAKKMRLNAPAQKQLEFQEIKVSSNTKIDLTSNDLLFGLHACGDLSIHLIDQTLENKNDLLSIPCCYHKQTKQNLSGHQNIRLNKFALNLANRSKVFMNTEKFNIRQEFKQYRYALEMIYYDQYQKKLGKLGNAHKSWYQLSFNNYVKKYHQDCFYLENLNNKYEKKLNELKDYILIESIRNPLARLLEQYLILDRVLYLEENAYDVEVLECFDPKLSPRNISLYATKKV